ncbi:MAG: hypothetical protein RL336_1487 [Pseudomonadota bacterium]
MRFGFLMLPLAMTIHLVSAAALADEDPRITRMQQTIQELTLQLGDALRENSHLRRQLDGQSTPQPSAQDCEPALHTAPVGPHSVPSAPVARPSAAVATPRQAEVAPNPSAKAAHCDIDTLEHRLNQFTDATTRESTLNTWLEDHGKHCSKKELRQLLDITEHVAFSDDATALIDYYLSRAK